MSNRDLWDIEDSELHFIEQRAVELYDSADVTIECYGGSIRSRVEIVEEDGESWAWVDACVMVPLEDCDDDPR